MSSDYVQIKLRSNKKHFFTDEKVVVYKPTGFVLFSGIVKVLCKGDDDSDAHGLWDKVLPKMTATKYMVKKGNLLVSHLALGILLNEYKDIFKDTWGVFAIDGFQQLTEDLKVVMAGGNPVEVVTKEEAKPKIPLDCISLLDARQANIVQNEKALAIRQDALEAREAAVLAREKTVNEREIFLLEKEKDLVQKVIKFDKDKKELEEQRKQVEDFIGESLKLAEKYTSPSSSKKRKTPSKVRFEI